MLHELFKELSTLLPYIAIKLHDINKSKRSIKEKRTITLQLPSQPFSMCNDFYRTDFTAPFTALLYGHHIKTLFINIKNEKNFVKRINVTMLGHKINLRDLNLWGRHWIVGGSSVSLLCPLVPGSHESLAGGGGS